MGKYAMHEAVFFKSLARRSSLAQKASIIDKPPFYGGFLFF